MLRLPLSPQGLVRPLLGCLLVLASCVGLSRARQQVREQVWEQAPEPRRLRKPGLLPSAAVKPRSSPPGGARGLCGWRPSRPLRTGEDLPLASGAACAHLTLFPADLMLCPRCLRSCKKPEGASGRSAGWVLASSVCASFMHLPLLTKGPWSYMWSGLNLSTLQRVTAGRHRRLAAFRPRRSPRVLFYGNTGV